MHVHRAARIETAGDEALMRKFGPGPERPHAKQDRDPAAEEPKAE